MNDSLDLAFSALADSTRRAILERLADGDATVAQLARPFSMSQPAISKHLKVLEGAGLIETEKRGKARPRRLKPDGLARAKNYVQEMASYWPDRFDQLDVFLKAQHHKGEAE